MNHNGSPLSGPLRIDIIHLEPAGVIGLTHCPGRSAIDGRGRAWGRDLKRDVEAIRQAGMGTVVTLLGDAELSALGAQPLGALLQRAGLRWLQFPIVDFGVPDARAQLAWRTILADLVPRLHADERVLVHCAAGLGRTGTMVATLLKALGHDTETAIAMVRAARPGTIETAAQRAFVIGFKP